MFRSLYRRATDFGLLAVALTGIALSAAEFATRPVDLGATVRNAADESCGDGACGNGVNIAKAIASIKAARGKHNEGIRGDAGPNPALSSMASRAEAFHW
jgi:uncharacterized low-complexity protein